MNTQRNTENLHVGGTATISTANYASGLNADEIGIFTEQGVRMTEALALTENYFVVASKDADSNIYTSPTYAKADIKSASRLVYTAATLQLDYLGSNGTTGSINVINDNLYKINIQVQELLRSSSDGRRAKFGIYLSDSAATQAEISIGLTGSLVDNFNREAEQFITFKAISSHTPDTNNTMDETVTITKGSKKISIATDYDYNTGTDLVVGDFIRIAPTDTATLVTDDVYRIEVITSTSDITLDRPIQIASGTRTHGNNGCEAITAAAALTADWGVALTGITLAFAKGKENYGVSRWESQMIDFGTTTDNRGTTAPTPGSGVINQMKQLEWFTRGNDGEEGRESFSTTHTAPEVVSSSVTGGGYDMIRLTFNSTHQVGFQNNVSPQVLTLITPATAPNYVVAGATDDITDVLEALAGTGIIAAGGLALA